MPSVVKRWELNASPQPQAVASLREALGCSPLLATLLLQREVTDPDAARRFLNPGLEHFHDPALLAGLPKAAERLAEAVRKSESIVVFGDYDVDGTSATALLVNFLREIGAEVDFYIPHRLKEGYGLSMEGIEKAVAAGTKVIVTVDNGVAHPDEVARAQAGGIDVIVTDHHRIPDGGSPAFAMVNPHQDGCTYPFKILAGSGIALNLALGLRRTLRERGYFGNGRAEPNLREYLDLASLGTIADVVPLQDVNRVIAHHGVEQMKRSRWTGLRSLVDLSIEEPRTLTAGDVAFQVAPRINAGGRLADATETVELLTTSDDARARVLAAVLDARNKERREIERAMVDEAFARIEKDKLLEKRRGIVLWREGWHPGVIGIVAARIVDRFHRPAVVVGILDGEGKGSARSISRYNIYEGIKSASEHLEQFGGHAQAAGFSVAPEKLDAFYEAFDRNVAAWTRPEDFEPRVRIDAEITPEDLNDRTIEEIARLAPFGMGNPEPVLALKEARLEGPREVGEGHLKGTLRGPQGAVDVIGFRLADAVAELGRTGGAPLPCDLAGSLEWNHFRGARKLQLRLRDLKPSRTGSDGRGTGH